MSPRPRGAPVTRPLLRHAAPPVAAFVLVLVVGTAGFAVLAGVGAVEAAFWLVDLTSIELHFRENEGPERLVKGFALLVRAAIVVTGLWFGETVLSAAFGGQLREGLRRVQTDRAIAELSDHVVVLGYGMFGETVARTLRAQGREVVIVDRDEAEARRARGDDYLVVQGDGRREETLVAAGVERAALLVAAVDDSNPNIQIAIVTSQLSPDLRLVVRVDDELYEPLARRAGADVVIIPEVVSGEHLCELL